MPTEGDQGVPVLVEIMVEREANAAMGKAIDAIVEFEPVPGEASPYGLVSQGVFA